MEQKGPILKIHNPSTNRDASICQITDILFGIMITEEVNGQVEEVTSFEKDKMKTLEQIIKYLNNVGYIQ